MFAEFDYSSEVSALGDGLGGAAPMLGLLQGQFKSRPAPWYANYIPLEEAIDADETAVANYLAFASGEMADYYRCGIFGMELLRLEQGYHLRRLSSCALVH